MQPLQKPLHDELGAEIEPLDLADHLGLQVLFSGRHGGRRDEGSENRKMEISNPKSQTNPKSQIANEVRMYCSGD
jgi:hypothetical protein